MSESDDFQVAWSEEDAEYVGTCSRYPSLSWLEKTTEAAMAGIRRLVQEVEADLASENK